MGVQNDTNTDDQRWFISNFTLIQQMHVKDMSNRRKMMS